MTGKQDAADGNMGESPEDAAWQDLVARFDVPDIGDGATPWPDREDLTQEPVPQPAEPQSAELQPAEPQSAEPQPAAPAPANPRSWSPVPDPADEHYIPPPPPPLPKLDSVAKGAWLALFGGPAYLVIALIAGWTLSGLAAFIAIAAFVGGFAVLVFRMGDGPPSDSGDDDGAVV